MSDAKSVIALLCKHLRHSIDCAFEPEYFRLAKYNKVDDNATKAFWTALHGLSRQAAKDIRTGLDFDRYDNFQATKLYFAFLRYPTIDFYSLSPKDNTRNRELLLAMGWLLATQDPLNSAIRTKLATSILGREHSRVEDDSSEKSANDLSSDDARLQMRGLVHACGRISHNVKEIDELTREKIKLATKIHGASLNACGLPHLSVSQLASAKEASTNGDSSASTKDRRSRKELQSIATILDIHGQWNKCQGVFYDWMITVIKESKNSDEDDAAGDARCDELSSFLSLLRHVTKKKLHSLGASEKPELREVAPRLESCCSRLIRTQRPSTEVESWARKTIERSIVVEADVEKKMHDLTSELREMLRTIPNCVEI